MEIVKRGYVTIYIEKESENLYVRDKNGKSSPVKYGVYGEERYPIGLREYMNIKNISAKKALEELESTGAVLLTNTFSINFFNKEDKDKFVKKIKE